MPLQFGFHPAFRCPFTPGKAREDYFVRFQQPEPGCPGGVFPLTADSFRDGCVFFPGLRSGWVQLEEKDTGRALRVDTGRWPHLALWSMPGVPGFVCIEPWSGLEGGGHDLFARPGAVALAPQETAHYVLDLSVL